MSKFDEVLDWFGHKIAARLIDERGYEPFTPSDPQTLRAALRPADVLLVEGSQKVSTAIKYLTQSTWSHAALYVGESLAEAGYSAAAASAGKPHQDGAGDRDENGDGDGDEDEAATGSGDAGADSDPPALVEVNLGEGCVAVPLSKYACFNTRICRPAGLMAADRQRVIDYMIAHLGTKYDMRNILDLARYLFPTPPVPARWRRRMISIGSGEPTRAICSTLIAQAFQQLRYPILPQVERSDGGGGTEPGAQRRREIFHIRHHSLFAPCDFDLSPYFQIVKPTIERGFDYKSLDWAFEAGDQRPAEGEAAASHADANADADADADADRPAPQVASRRRAGE